MRRFLSSIPPPPPSSSLSFLFPPPNKYIDAHTFSKILAEYGTLDKYHVALKEREKKSVNNTNGIVLSPLDNKYHWTTLQHSISSMEDNGLCSSQIMEKYYQISKGTMDLLSKYGHLTIYRPSNNEKKVKKLKGPVSVKYGDLLVMTEHHLMPRLKEEEKKKKDVGSDEWIRGLILYEDSSILAINKPSGFPCHEGEGWEKGKGMTVMDWLPILSPTNPLIPLHRLDLGTSGVLLFAKDKLTSSEMRNEWDKIKKVYWSLVDGRPRKGHYFGEISSLIYRIQSSPHVIVPKEKMTSFADKRTDLMDEGQAAITKYRFMHSHKCPAKMGWLSLMELIPQTGRTHQLRVHMAEQLKMPIWGDYRYWSSQPGGRKLHLHCRSITLPGGGPTIEAPMPSHFCETMIENPIKIYEPPKPSSSSTKPPIKKGNSSRYHKTLEMRRKGPEHEKVHKNDI